MVAFNKAFLGVIPLLDCLIGIFRLFLKWGVKGLNQSL
ncbi:putative membrane protein [Helicobacter pylori Hp H-16]|nr:putative membrane protein [Helicobacter pylori Hp H-16]